MCYMRRYGQSGTRLGEHRHPRAAATRLAVRRNGQGRQAGTGHRPRQAGGLPGAGRGAEIDVRAPGRGGTGQASSATRYSRLDATSASASRVPTAERGPSGDARRGTILIYVDTSALMKLVWPERGTEAVDAFVGDREDLISSALLTVEARRAALRAEPAALPRVDLLLDRFEFIHMSDAVIETASRLPDPMLRTLDAIHLATALLIRDDVDVLISYEDRLLAAAASHGLSTAAPG